MRHSVKFLSSLQGYGNVSEWCLLHVNITLHVNVTGKGWRQSSASSCRSGPECVDAGNELTWNDQIPAIWVWLGLRPAHLSNSTHLLLSINYLLTRSNISSKAMSYILSNGWWLICVPPPTVLPIASRHISWYIWRFISSDWLCLCFCLLHP